jgi:hypothetical protein
VPIEVDHYLLQKKLKTTAGTIINALYFSILKSWKRRFAIRQLKGMHHQPTLIKGPNALTNHLKNQHLL